MTRQFAFLLAAVRQFFRPESPLPSVQGLDWSEVLRLADRHSVTAFLHQACQTPELTDSARDEARSNLTLSAELLKLIDLFDKHAIDVVPLKGPVLGVALYQDKALKTSSDLDLFVRPSDALRAKRALEGIGYRLTSVPHWPADSGYLRNLNNELSFSDPAGWLKLDLHWHLLPGYFPAPFDDAELWAKLRSVPWGPTHVRTLAPEHQFLFLCAHGTKHVWERLGWLCDAARLLQVEPEINWSEVFAQARRTHTTRMVSLGLLLASDLLGVELPPAAAELAGADPHARALAATVRERLRADSPTSAVATALFSIRAFERTSHRARLIFGIFLQPTEAEYRLLQLPPALYWFYYLFRPLRLATKYARRLLD